MRGQASASMDRALLTIELPRKRVGCAVDFSPRNPNPVVIENKLVGSSTQLLAVLIGQFGGQPPSDVEAAYRCVTTPTCLQ